MKTIIFTLVITCMCCISKAQNLIAVEHSGVSKFYSTLDSAVNAALTGDNVYVPGGNFTLSVNISKGFNLIGVGYNPDSTTATGLTQITSPANVVYIVTGADNGSITGIYFYNTTIAFGTSPSNQTVNNYTISRSRIYSVYLGNYGNTNSVNIVLTENVIDGTFDGGNLKNSSFSKNIIDGQLNDFSQGNQFLNNILLFSSSYSQVANNDSNCLFKNNIFLSTVSYNYNGYTTNCYNNIFYNNLFASGGTEVNLAGTGNGDIFNVAQSSIFVNQTGNSYDYKQNYHLQTTCPGHNYGTDGTDLGVYGTATPWKEGGVPYNPHIQFQSIATQTDGNGNLSVNIKVAAQKN